jgi:hypothetical protein
MPNTPIVKVWTFPSSSNPDKTYETLLRESGYRSCNCPGWCQRVAKNGSRSCKHTRLVDQGIADQECTASHTYTESQPAPPITQTAPPVRLKGQSKGTLPATRKIRWKT